MSDFADKSQGPNPFRPYADSTGARTTAMFDELRNPLDSLRAATSGQFESPLALPPNTSVTLEPLDSVDFGEYSEHVDTAQAAGELMKFAFYRYLATLAASPFSMAQTLQQVQYLPEAARQEAAKQDRQRSEETDNDEAPDPDDPAYYEYLRARQAGSSAQYRAASRARVDHNGYIRESSTAAAGGEAVKLGFQLEPLAGNKLAVLRAVVRQPTEGILSLFKGAFTQWAYDMLHLLLQPTLEGALNELLGLYDHAPMGAYIDVAAPSALTLVASSVLVGWLLSPLELVRTRLAVQSASPVHRKYNGTVHALRTVASEEGGVRALYLSPIHVIPTVVKHALDAVFRNMGSFMLARGAGLDAYDQPAAFALGSLVWKTLSVAVMLPIDTVRARLMAQPRYSARTKSSQSLKSSKGTGSASRAFKEFRTCVPLAPVPYTGMANCAWRIITEEGESLKSLRRRRAAIAKARANGDNEKAELIGRVGHYGLRGLYPGVTLQLAANLAIFGLGFISTDDLDDAF